MSGLVPPSRDGAALNSKLPAAISAARPTRILLIEDVAATAEIVRAHLSAIPSAAQVHWANSLRVALDMCARDEFDLIIADLNLPDSHGLATLERLASATDCLIVVLTVEQGEEVRDAALALGAYDFLQKSSLNRATLGHIVRLATMQANTFRSLRESEARFRSLVALSSDFYWETDHKHRIVQTTRDAKLGTNNSRAEQVGKTPWDIPSTRPDREGWEAYRTTMDSHLPFRDFEVSRLGADGVERHLLIGGEPIFGEGGRFLGYRGVGRNITPRKQAEDRIRYLATRDALTGLPNRNLLGDRFVRLIAQAKRQGTLLAVLFVDLDGLKQANDTLGHAAGDELLKAVARHLETLVREGDTVARVAGDEFVILLGDIGERGSAALVARKILEALTVPVSLPTGHARVGASVGIAMYPTDGTSAEGLLSAADAAMYRVKESGRNSYQFYSP